jgi:aspartate/methionine/tyrosine aminotransferase
MNINEFKLERFFSKYEFSAPYLLCSSDPESFSIKELLSFQENTLDRYLNQKLGYTETMGSLALREQIISLYKTIKPENIFVHTGAEEGIFILMNVLFKPGDHIIVQFPAYQSLYEVANSIGCKITKWIVNKNKGWDLDTAFLETNINKNTKAIIINSPHNPTGYMPDQNKFNQIIEIAKKNNLLVIADEVYRFLEHNDADRISAACDSYENGISIGSMSKSFGLPGLRTGWTATKNITVLEKMAAFKDYTTICTNAPGELLTILAFKHKEQIFKRNLEIIRKNLKLLNEFFDGKKDLFRWIKPKGGTTAFVEILSDADIESFSIDLVNKKGVFVLPSTVYDFGNKHFRIGYGRKNMPECLEKFSDYIKNLDLKILV